MDLAPFDPPLTESECRLAWRGGLRRPPTWARDPALLLVDTAGVHALLRAAGLPREELLHMGWGAWALGPSAPLTISERVVAPLLGRVVLDTRHGAPWTQDMLRDATAAGQLVLERWFPGEDLPA